MKRFVIPAVVLALVLAAGSFVLGASFAPRLEGFDPVLDAAEQIEARAAEPVSRDELVRAAVRGMLDALEDPHAAFLDPGRVAEIEELTSGSYVGVGFWLEAGPEGPTVASVLEGSPAARAGIAPGDVIRAVDGRPTTDLAVAEMGRLLAGAEGETVNVTIESAGGQSRDVRLVRERIPLGQVAARSLPEGVAYIRPVAFARGVGEQVGDAVRRFASQGSRGLILDLRGNPGGLTDEALRVAGIFLGEQVAARLEDGRSMSATGPQLTGAPLAVLVDGGTASAAELVAGALQDHERAVLVGLETFGKGALVETIETPGAGGAIQLTTATFVTPDGHPVEGVGLVPDVPVLPGGPVDAQLDRAVRVVLGEPAA